MKFNNNKKGIMNIFFNIITAVIIFSCAGGSKSKPDTNEFPQTEILDTLTIPKDAVPIVYQGCHIYIVSEVDSISGNFLFDTGADELCFDSIYYANNPFRKFKFRQAMVSGIGAGGTQSSIVITDTVNFKFKNLDNNLAFIPIMSLKPILGDFVDGILGKEYFNNQILEINYFQKYIKLYDNINLINISDYTKINMKKQHNRFFVPSTIKINNAVTIQANLLLDIGSGGSIDITSAIANKYKLPSIIVDKIQYYTKHGGISGHSVSEYFRASSVEIGNYKLDDVIMGYSEDKSGSLSRSDYAGLLGNKILERFDVIIDFMNNDLYLKPNQNYNKLFNFSKLGFAYVDRNATMNAWVVTGFDKGSNAEIAGLKIDDKIISVNNIDIHKIPIGEQTDFWERIDKVSLIILRNGIEKRIEFDLKYVL